MAVIEQKAESLQGIPVNAQPLLQLYICMDNSTLCVHHVLCDLTAMHQPNNCKIDKLMQRKDLAVSSIYIVHSAIVHVT